MLPSSCMKGEVWLPGVQELSRQDGTWELEHIQANLVALDPRTTYQLGEHGHVTTSLGLSFPSPDDENSTS